MLSSLTRIVDYIGYLFGSTDLHGIHSPFIYKWAELNLYHKEDKRIESVEFQRTQMLKSNGEIYAISLAKFVDSYTLPAKHAFAISKIVAYFDIRKISEYGKCCGIETNYTLFHPLKQKGVPISYSYFSTIENPIKIQTNETWLKSNLDINPKIDWNSEIPDDKIWELSLVHLTDDAEELWKYWEDIKPKLHNHSIVVFTNIRKSDDHFLAWKQLTNESEITVDIDLFRMGCLFFRKEQPKESFLLRY